MNLLLSVISILSALKLAMASEGEYNVSCVMVDGQCARGTQDFGAYALTNFDNIAKLVDTYNGLSEEAAKLMMYGVLNAGADYSLFQTANTSQAKFVRRLLHDNAHDSVDCGGYSSELAKVCTAAQQSQVEANLEAPFGVMASYTINCNGGHANYRVADCSRLSNLLTENPRHISGGPRNIQWNSCYVSWSQDADFTMGNLASAFNAMLDQCAQVNNYQSGKASNVHLSGTTVNECLSDRASGCT